MLLAGRSAGQAMGAAAVQCRAAVEPGCKAASAELAVPCEPCIAALEDDQVFIDPARFWHEAVSSWDPEDSKSRPQSAQPRGEASSSSGGRTAQKSRERPSGSSRDPNKSDVGPSGPGNSRNSSTSFLRECSGAGQGDWGALAAGNGDSAKAGTGFGEDDLGFKTIQESTSGARTVVDEAEIETRQAEFLINRFRTSTYLPAGQALGRLPDPEDEVIGRAPPPPKNGCAVGAALDLSREVARQQRSAEPVAEETTKPNSECSQPTLSRVDSLPADHLPVQLDHLRQPASVVLPLQSQKVSASAPASSASLFNIPPLIPAVPAPQVLPATLSSVPPQVLPTPHSSVPAAPPLVCYATAALARQAASRSSQIQAAAMEQQTAASLQFASAYAPTLNQSPQKSAFAIRV